MFHDSYQLSARHCKTLDPVSKHTVTYICHGVLILQWVWTWEKICQSVQSTMPCATPWMVDFFGAYLGSDHQIQMQRSSQIVFWMRAIRILCGSNLNYPLYAIIVQAKVQKKCFKVLCVFVSETVWQDENTVKKRKTHGWMSCKFHLPPGRL